MAMVADANLVNPVIYSSFNLESLRIARQIVADGQYCLLTDRRVNHPAEFIYKEHLSGLHLHHYQEASDVTERIWTVNNESDIRQLVLDGVAGIITDNFELARKVRDSCKRIAIQ